MFFPNLLAKSIEGNDQLQTEDSRLLVWHLRDVYQSAEALVTCNGIAQLQAIGLDPSEWLERFRKTLLLAAAIHDLGKANNHFQAMIHDASPRPDRKQPIRHEWISIWIANQPAMKQWLLPAVDGCELCWHIAMFAVSGHHPKTGRAAPSLSTVEKGAEPVEVLSSHEDFENGLQHIRDWFGLDRTLPEVAQLLYRGRGDQQTSEAFAQVVKDLDVYWRNSFKRKHEWRRLCAITKVSLICADVAGSALWEKLENPEQRSDWIQECLGHVPTRDDFVAIVNARLGENKSFNFQNQIAASTASVTLLEAGCGGGKTVAAYMWARDQHVGRRLWFCYPTTGTATEGFRGYLDGSLPQDSKSIADLFHSRADFDKLRLLDNPERDETDSEGADDDEVDTESRIESLKAWYTDIVSCTIDTVFALLQNQRKGLYAWPSIANSAIVFDEVHCYGETLFGELLTWIEKLPGIPLLIMTASLPSGDREAIRQAAQAAGRTFNHIPLGSEVHEKLPRYQNAFDQPLTDIEVAIKCAENEHRAGGRVLWISNTVDRSRGAAERLSHLDPIVYHSRFIYEDRLERHKEIVAAFEKFDPVFASTTQVAEMSLDLGTVTLLITELATIPALIQRLGRLNRRADPDAKPPVVYKFIVLEPPPDNKGNVNALPYEDHQLEYARKWLAQLGIKPVSQRKLVEAWIELDHSEPGNAERSTWLEGGAETLVLPVRDSSPGVTVICERHVQKARKFGATQFTLPMNHPGKRSWKSNCHSVRGYPIATDSAIDYHPKTGATWSSFNNF
jgi:CRISPR-associated endonuclease/helicase Cas3